MKTIIIATVLLFIFVATTVKASNWTDHFSDNFVMTNSDTIFCENVNVSENKISLKKTNGEKIINSYEDVVMYKKDGKMFKKLPCIVNGSIDTKRKPVFFELVTHKQNMDLMRSLTYESSTNNLVEKYYVFENNKFILELDSKNQNFLLDYFTKNN